jgi:tetratricopeptide (TPR) repeat protein
MNNPVRFSSSDKVDSMGSEELTIISNELECRDLEEEILNVRTELARETKRNQRKELINDISDLRSELAWTLMDLRRYEKALFIFGEIPWQRHEEEKCTGMARALTEMGHYDEARRLLGRGLKSFPRSHRLWMCLGCLHDNLGDHHESLRCFDISHKLAPSGSWEALYNKAVTLEKLGSYGEAAAIFEDLIKEHPEKPRFFTERGYCALHQGYPQEAIQYYQRAMRFWEQAPSVYEGVCVYSGLCTAYAELGLKKEATEIALEGLKKFPDEDSILYHNVGVTFFGMGWKQEAREVLKKGVEKFPEDEELKNLFQNVEESMDDPDGGVKPPRLGLILLTALIYKQMRDRRRA